MGDGKSADSIQIEIEASSADAKKKVNALSDALERLKRASTGYGDISGKIRDIGESARGAVGSKTRKRRDALDRAVKPVSVDSASLKTVLPKTEEISKAVELAKNKYDELVNYVNQNSGRITRNAAEEALRSMRAEQDGLEEILKIFKDSIAPKELYAAADALKDVELKLREAWNNPAPQKINMSAVEEAKHAQEEVKKLAERERGTEPEVIESKDKLKEKLGIIQRIADIISQISGKKIDIGSASGLKDLLGKDLSLQNLIPKGASASVDALKNSVGGLTDKLMGFASAHPAVAAGLVALTVVLKTVGQEIKSFAKTVKSVAKNAVELLKNGIKNLTSALVNLARSGVSKAVSGLKSLAKAAGDKIVGPFKRAAEAYNKWKSSLGRVAFYRAVRGAIKALTDGIKTGVDNLYQYSKLVGTDFAPAMDKLATSALYLKNSIGAMAAPLIEAIAPAVDLLVDKFVELLNVIGKTFSALTGKDVYSQARKHAVEYAESADDAKKKTDEFKKFLLGIDELNIMPEQDQGTDAVKNPLEDYASMFEEVQVPVEQLDWAKQIRDAIENGDWYSVGRIVAEKLNEIVDRWDAYAWGRKLGDLITNGLNVAFAFLENFDFENLGSKIADGLNGIFDGIDWDLLGRTLAEKWNALFDFIYGFATSLNWTGIGLDIATAFNGFLDQLDPAKAAAAANEFILGIFRMLNTAITETNWAELGAKLAQFINGIDWAGIVYNGLMVIVNGLDAIKELVDAFLDEWDWKQMANDIAAGINTALAEVDWDGIGNTLGNIFIAAFNFLRETIQKIDWASIGRDVASLLNGIEWTDLLSGLASTIASAFNAVVAALSSLVQDLHWEEIGKAIGTAINVFFSTFDWVAFLTGLANLAVGLMDGLSAALETVDWDAAWANIKAGLDKVDWGALVESAGRLIVDAFVAKMKLKIIEGKAFFSIGGNIIGGLLEGITDKIKNIGAWLKEHLVDPVVNGVKDLFGIHSPSKVFDEIGGFLIEGLLEGITKSWDGIVEFFGGKLGDLKDAISKKWEEIKQNTSEKWDNVKSTISTALSGMKSTAENEISKIKTSISTAWKNVTSGASNWGRDLANNLASGIRSGISSITSAVSSVASRVRSYLHFSEPDIGPLSDFHTYMPDMMALMAKGINQNSYLAVNATSGLADKMSRALSDIEPVEPRFAVHEDLFTSVQPYQNRQGNPPAEVVPQYGQVQNNMEIINAIFAVGQQIVNAVNENADRPIEIDWDSVSSGVTTNQNRKNMMYGKTLQNT